MDGLFVFAALHRTVSIELFRERFYPHSTNQSVDSHWVMFQDYPLLWLEGLSMIQRKQLFILLRDYVD